ncbi:GIN domain-containing protein [Flavobacterium agrisoli]|uniref:DUF2807 domain-containing protein n=1 Tax=Flavobacterium agrisoli TaxID=2793066 RepID=A0A934PMC3_9FLAO|nr:DUF2807 domain-containing protein [Flavobacterium agrisoli]MBK0370842.1 DUF2807 domain-containing protein [Flavobacterium agrisoli]
MKKATLIFLLIFSTTLVFGQRKDRIKGSKSVTVELKEIGSFNQIDIEDNIEVFLEKGTKNEVKIEADSNLHDIIELELRDKNLRIYTSKRTTIFKKLVVHVVYTNELKMVTAKNDVHLYAIEELNLDDITLKSNDYAKLFLNVNSKKFSLIANDKSKIELNLKAEEGTIQLNQNTDIKALVATTQFNCDMYQKTTAAIEGESVSATIRLDNNAVFTGNKLTIKSANLTSENYANCSIFAAENISIAAAGETETYLYGNPKIQITRFANQAQLLKVPK